MAKSGALPRVLLVGRMNVGKSQLFNRLSTQVKSLIFDYEGVTRDFITDTVTWNDVSFELVDTGGLSFKKQKEEITQQVNVLVRSLLDTADAVVFVTDANAGILQEDRDIAKVLHKQGVPTCLVVNKVDNQEVAQRVYEFSSLGFGEPIGVSALHGLGANDVLEAIIKKLEGKQVRPKEEQEDSYKIVLLGKPNVGKSSLMNALLGKDRSIVSDVAGTTREAVSDTFTFFKESIEITDTAGIRRKRSVEEPLEKMMVKSSLWAIDRSDLVLLLIDGSEKRLSDQELKLAFYAFEEGKSLAILVNKSDLVDEQDKTEWDFNTQPYAFFLKKIPVLFISCKSGKNVNKILPLVANIRERSRREISSAELRVLCINALHERPLYHGGSLLHVINVKQVKNSPITFSMQVNHPDWFGPSQIAFFENVIRSTYDFEGVPLLFTVHR
jgi:GTP-binding protein